MPKTKEQKQEILNGLEDNIEKQTAITFVDFKGLTVKDMSAVRKELAKCGATLVVAKKTLMQRALKEKGIDVNLRGMEGQTAAVFAFEDSVMPTKAVDIFSKTNAHLQILGGYFENKIQGLEQMKVIASLPSKDGLRAKLVGTIAAPISGFATVLQGNIKGLVVVLGAIATRDK